MLSKDCTRAFVIDSPKGAVRVFLKKVQKMMASRNMKSEKHLLSILNRPTSFSATAPVIERSSDIVKFQQIVPSLSD